MKNFFAPATVLLLTLGAFANHGNYRPLPPQNAQPTSRGPISCQAHGVKFVQGHPYAQMVLGYGHSIEGAQSAALAQCQSRLDSGCRLGSCR